jgi:hypothetical protein
VERMGNTLTIDLNQPLSPSERLMLSNIQARQPKPAQPPAGVREAINETFGERDGKR